MSNRASESVRVGTFWNSPSLRSEDASSSPVIFSRVREVGAVCWVVIMGGNILGEGCSGGLFAGNRMKLDLAPTRLMVRRRDKLGSVETVCM